MSHIRGRKIVRKYLVRSPYKQVIKTMRYNKPKYTARRILKSPKLNDATVDAIKQTVKHECELLCKKTPVPSCLRLSSIKDLSSFQWEALIKELQSTAPVLTSVLSAAAQVSMQTKPNMMAVCVAASLLLKQRCIHLCKIHMIVSSLLYAGHAAKKASKIIMLIL